MVAEDKRAEFEESLQRLRANDDNLTELRWWQWGLDANDAAALADALRGNATLHRLNLGRNYDIGCDGIAALADALKNNVSVTVLDVQDNRIDNDGAAALADALRSNATLDILDLHGNSIGDIGAAALANSLESNNTLSTLDLGNNDIGDDSAAALANALKNNATLVTLVLEINRIGDDGAAALADALYVNHTVKNVRLHHMLGALNRISEGTMDRINEYLSSNRVGLLSAETRKMGTCPREWLTHDIPHLLVTRMFERIDEIAGDSSTSVLFSFLREHKDIKALIADQVLQ